MNKIKQIILSIFLSNTARNTIFVFSGNMVSAVLAFLFTVVLYRSVSLSDFGYYSALLSLLLLVSDISDLGIGASLARFLPPLKKNKKRIDEFTKSAFIYQFIIAIFFSIVVFFGADYISNNFFHDILLSPLVRLTTLGILSLAGLQFFGYILSALEKFVVASFISALSSILRLGFLLIVILIGQTNLVGLLWAQVLSLLFTGIVAFIFVGGSFFGSKIQKKDLLELIHFSKYLGIARSLTALSSRLDVIMLIALTNSIETGIYSTSSRVISIYPLLAGSFTSVIAPRISAIEKKEEFFKYIKKINLATLGLIGTILILMVIAYPFITILFGQKASDSVGVFRVLLLSQIFFTASIPAVAIAIYYVRKPYILTVNSILQLFTVVVGNLIFIPRFSRYGPAISLVFAFGVSVILTTLMSLYHLKKHHEK